MDTSEQYIKMCEKAEEIQKALRKQMGVSAGWGDWCITHNRPYFDHNDRYSPQLEGKCKPLIIPRQDQLQEMMGRTVPFYYQFKELADFYRDYGQYSATHEQLWLAFVMKEKYNKVWDGEDWIDGS